jgi:AraC-like DNA-binding protein/mannose-6-phosphate isomerase-like protein (cupin superfamily)
MAHLRKLSVDACLKLLMDPLCPLHLELSGMPVDFRPRVDWRVQLDGIQEHLFYFCLQGSLQVEVGDASESLSSGDAVWISPSQRFRLSSPDPRHARISRFRLQLKDAKGRRVALETRYLRSVPASAYFGWLEVLRQECVLTSGAPPLELRCALAGLLGAAFREKLGGDLSGSEGRKLSITQIRILQDWLHQIEPHARPDSGALAARLQLSRDYFNRLCHATFGVSAERWLIRQRIEAAAMRLIESNRSVSEVADEYGYSSLYFFSRQFRQVLGLSPTSYRSQYLGRLAGK